MDLVVNNGKVDEPGTLKKVLAAVTFDKEAVIVLPAADVQTIVVQHLWRESSWLSRYGSAVMEFDEGRNCFVMKFMDKQAK